MSSAADPRPGGKPFYIEPNCPSCGTALVLLDVLEKARTIWHDEWVCPNHVDEGVYLDHPRSNAAMKADRAADPRPPGQKISLWLDAEVAETVGLTLVDGTTTFHVLRLLDGSLIAMTPEALDAHTNRYRG